MSRRLAIAAVSTLGLLALVPAPASAQGNGPCTHQGRPVQCPAGLPPGSGSIEFVPGGTNWRNSVTGAVVFVPSSTFPPFVATPTPTTPPGPTTQPGPGQPTGGPPLVFPFTPQGQIYLTQPADRDVPVSWPPSAELGKALRKLLAEAGLKATTAAADAASQAYKGVIADLGLASGASSPQEFAAKDRLIVLRGEGPDFRSVVVRITPNVRGALARYEEAKENYRRSPTRANDEAQYRVFLDYRAAVDAVPVDQAATERLQSAEDASRRAVRAQWDAQAELDAANEKPEVLEGSAPEVEESDAEVEESDADKAPRFEPFKDQGAVDEVM
jgi:hypothetical protein